LTERVSDDALGALDDPPVRQQVFICSRHVLSSLDKLIVHDVELEALGEDVDVLLVELVVEERGEDRLLDQILGLLGVCTEILLLLLCLLAA